MSKFKFKWEPTLFLQALSAVLALVVTFGLPGLSDEQAGLIVAVVAAVLGVINAWKVRPIAPAIFQTLITTGAALLTAYGLDLNQQTVGALQLAVIAIVAMLTRQQVSPVPPAGPPSVVR